MVRGKAVENSKRLKVIGRVISIWKVLKFWTATCTMPAHSLPPAKKRRVERDAKVLQSIQASEQQLTRAVEHNASLNPLADLLDTVSSCTDSQDVSKGIYALYRVFVLVVVKGKLSVAGDDSAKAVKTWLWERMHLYVEHLCGLMKDDEKTLRVRRPFPKNSLC